MTAPAGTQQEGVTAPDGTQQEGVTASAGTQQEGVTAPLAAPEIRWIEGPEALAAISADWAALAARTGADPYLSPGWIGPWWRQFGAGQTLHCLTLRADGRLVGVLPFAVRRVWAGPVPVRLARLAGIDPHCLVLDPPVEAGYLPGALAEAARQLLGPLGCSCLSLTPVSDLSALTGALGALPSGMHLHQAPAGGHVVFDLPESFDAYLAGLSKKRRGQFRRDLAGLEAEFGATAGHRRPDAAAFAGFVAFHDRQWQAVGKGGHFTDWPGSAEFYGALAGQGEGQGTGGADFLRFFDLAGAEGPLATQFALLGARTCHWRLPARSLDPRAEKLSAGKVGLLLMIRDLIGMGVGRIEAGRGDYDYKLSYGGRQVPVRQVVLCRAGRAARARLALLLAWADLVDFLYYRAWFKKLAPRLRSAIGGRPRPLWQLWLRSRV